MSLKTIDIEKLREEQGYNEISRKKQKTKFEVIIDIFKDPIIIIMICAMIISILNGYVTKHYTESFVILSLVSFNVVISFIQEIKTIEKLKALDDLNQEYVNVIRDYNLTKIPARELLVGDLVKLNIGMIARADIIVTKSQDLYVDESFLTGESDIINKNVNDIIYSNSGIKSGNGFGEVIAIAMNTKIGEIAKQVDDVEVGLSQLEKKVKQITNVLLIIALITSSLVLLLSLLNGLTILNTLSLTISILIATVPEGLATVLTIVLTFMAQKMTKNNALIKKVSLLETLGEVSYVCTDKTGTITENKMVVVNENIYDDFGYQLLSSVIDSDTPTSKAIYESTNGSRLKVKIIDELVFNSQIKMQAKLVEYNDIKYIVCIGASEVLVDKKNDKVIEYSNDGKRCILSTFKQVNENKIIDIDLKNLSLGVLFAISDPPKESAKKAILELQKASINVVMITGDNLLTATAIAKQTNIINSDSDLCISKEELDKLTEEEFLKIVENIRVYARVQPQDKYRIVNALQKCSQIVSMTGDGTNDSIALKKANVGVAMGINGTDISKESADLILLDDNFSTINTSVKYGRMIFDNLKKFIRQMLTSNAAHTGSILFTLLFGVIYNNNDLILPMTSVLILWVNVVSDAIPCLALGLDVFEDDIMTRKPIDPNLKILDKKMIFEILLRGFSIGFLVYLVFTKSLSLGFSEEYSRSLGFVVLSFGQLIHIFDARSFKTIYRKNPFSNKLLLQAVLLSAILNLSIMYTPINQIFGLSPISLNHLLIMVLISSIVTFGYSIFKLFLIKK